MRFIRKNKVIFRLITLFFLISIILFVGQLLSSCGNGNNPDIALNTNSPEVAADYSLEGYSRANLSPANQGNLIPQLDIYSLNYDLTPNPGPLTKCTSTKSYCVTLNRQPTVVSYSGADAVPKWLIPNYPFTLRVDFDTAIPAGFHIAELYNDLNNTKYSGHISQINAADCEQAAGSARSSCVIKLIYTGDNDTLATNQIHVVFSSKSAEPFDFSFMARNQQQTASAAVLNAHTIGQVAQINLYPEEVAGKSGIDYPFEISNKFKLTNYGANLMASSTPSITPILGWYSDLAGSELLAFSYMVGAYTSCADFGVAAGASCDFPFKVEPKVYDQSGNLVISSQYAQGLFQYHNNQESINYLQPLVVSVGDLLSNNYTLSNNDGKHNNLLLIKKNLSAGYFGYSLPLKNLRLSAQYIATFNLGVSLDLATQRLKYSYGDYNGQNIQNLLTKIKFSLADPKCLERTYDSDSDGYALPQTQSCRVIVDYGPIAAEVNHHPLQFQLYAEYDSPTENRHVQQLIGNVTLNPQAVCNVIANSNHVYDLATNVDIHAGQCLQVNNVAKQLKTELMLQNDGNLVLRQCNSKESLCWLAAGATSHNLSNTTDSSGLDYVLKVQTDGNLVIYSHENKALWASNTIGEGYHAILDNQDSVYGLNFKVLSADYSQLIWAASGPSINPQQRPLGDYTTICHNIAWSATGILTADCPQNLDPYAPGATAHNQLDYAQACYIGSAILLKHGVLSCALAAASMPKGGYADYCTKVQWDGQNKLTATCYAYNLDDRYTAGVYWVDLSVDTSRCVPQPEISCAGCGRKLKGDGANLVCDLQPPPGSYTASCNQIKYDGYHLWANCGGNSLGLYYKGQCKPDSSVSYLNGQLVCDQSKGLPPGPWINSCSVINYKTGDYILNSGIYIHGVLSAKCGPFSSSHWSKINYLRDCQANTNVLVDANNNLKCEKPN